MPYVELQDATLHYEVHGQGAPLLLLHAGWGLAINGFEYQASALDDESCLIVPDRRGYGRSTRAACTQEVREFVRNVCARGSSHG
jgi:3-oxoadipate enol-lactonase